LEEFISFDMFNNINRNLELGYTDVEIHDGFEIIGVSSRLLKENEKKFLEKLVENIFLPGTVNLSLKNNSDQYIYIKELFNVTLARQFFLN